MTVAIDTKCQIEECGHPKGAHQYDYDRGTYAGCTRAECRCVRYLGPIMLRPETATEMLASSHHTSPSHAITEREPMVCTRCEHADTYHVGGPCHYEVEPYGRLCDCRIFLPLPPKSTRERWGSMEWYPSDPDPDPEKPYGVDLVELSKAIKAVEKGYLTRQAPEIVAAAKAFLDFHEAALDAVKAVKEFAGVIAPETFDEVVEITVVCAHGETGEHRFFDTADDGRIITRKCSGPLGAMLVKDGTGEVVGELGEWSLVDEDEDLDGEEE